MNNANWIDFFQKMFSVFIGGLGTYLAARSYYEKRHQETLEKFAQSREKAYAAERDFEHLRRNQEQMKESLRVLDGELTDTRADFKELKGMLMVAFGRAGDSISGIFAYKEKKE